MKDRQRVPMEFVESEQQSTAAPTAPAAPTPLPLFPGSTSVPGPTVGDDPLARLSPDRGGLPAITRPDRFVYEPERYRDQKSQVKYGPGEGLSPEDQELAYQKIYGATPPTAFSDADAARPLLKKRPRQPKDKQSAIFERLTQYDDSHGAYLEHAHRTGRPLTVQEQTAQDRRDNAPDSSINHVIASGVGQNTLNQSLAHFSRGAGAMPTRDHLGPALDDDDRRRDLAKSLGLQAAAVGRMQMYNRAIALENHKAPDSADSSQPAVTAARHELLRDTLALMEHGGLDRYKGLLKKTFDSPGNLRVGHEGANGAVSTGLDVELTPQGLPTPRSSRLQEAHLAAAPDHDTEIWTTFAHDPDVPQEHRGAALSSSQEAANPAMSDEDYLPPEPAPAPSFVKRPRKRTPAGPRKPRAPRTSIKSTAIDPAERTRARAQKADARARARREATLAERRRRGSSESDDED